MSARRGWPSSCRAPRATSGRNPDVPIENLRGGADYITQQLQRFGNVPHALAAYNAGPGAVMKHDGIPPYEETQGYVRRITGYLQRVPRHDRRARRARHHRPLGLRPGGVRLRLGGLVGLRGGLATPRRSRSWRACRTIVHRHRRPARRHGRGAPQHLRPRRARPRPGDAGPADGGPSRARQGAHAQHLAADRLAERRFARMGVTQ